MATGFKKRPVSPDRVAVVESVTAGVPLVGDPRMAASVHTVPDPLPTVDSKVGSRQVLNLGASQDLGGDPLIRSREGCSPKMAPLNGCWPLSLLIIYPSPSSRIIKSAEWKPFRSLSEGSDWRNVLPQQQGRAVR